MVVWQPFTEVARVVRSWVGGDRAVLLTFMVTTLPDMLNRTALDRKFTSTSCNRLCADRDEGREKEVKTEERKKQNAERGMTISRSKE
jgi:hypothetical protein